MTILHYPGVRPRGVGAKLTWLSLAGYNPNGGTATFTAQDVGPPAGGKRLILGILAGGGGTRTVVSVTVDGILFDIVGQISTSSTTVNCCAMGLAPRLGPTANIVIVFSGGVTRCGIDVWSGFGLVSNAAYHFQSSGANPSVLNLNTKAGGMAVAFNGGAGTHTITWVGATKRSEHSALGSGSTGHMISAADIPTTVEGVTGITSTRSGNDADRGSFAASWQVGPRGASKVLDRTLGTILTNFTNNPANAFDGNTNQAIASGAYKAGTAANNYIGRSRPVAIEGVTTYGSNNEGYVMSANPTVTLTLYGKQGAAPASGTDGTALGSIAFLDTGNENAGRIIASSDTSTYWDHVWVNMAQSTTNVIAMAELVMRGWD